MSTSKHTAYNIIGSVVPVAITLLTVPLYLNVVGIERYGVLTVCWVLLGYLGFLDLGLAPAVSQRIASTRDEQPGEAETIFWSATWASVGMGAVSACLFYGGAALYFGFVGLNSAFDDEIKAAIPLLGAIVPVAMVSSVGAGALQARHRFFALNLIHVISSTLMSILPLLIAYLWSPTLTGLLAGALAARLVGLVLQYANCLAAVPLTKVQMPRRKLIASLLKFGGWVTVSTAVAPLLVTVDRLAIGAVLGAAAVAAYSIPFSLISRMSIVPGALSSALFPRFAAGTDAERKRLLTVAVSAIAVTMTPLCILVIILVEPFFTLWLGAELAARSSLVACFLVAGAWANSIALLPFSMLQGSGRPDTVAKIHLSELLPYWAVLAASLYLFGLTGAAMAWSLRTGADCLLLYWRSGLGFASLAQLITPFLLIIAALAALAIDGPMRWGSWAATFGLACIWSSYHLPEVLRARLGAIGNLLPHRPVRD